MLMDVYAWARLKIAGVNGVLGMRWSVADEGIPWFFCTLSALLMAAGVRLLVPDELRSYVGVTLDLLVDGCKIDAGLCLRLDATRRLRE